MHFRCLLILAVSLAGPAGVFAAPEAPSSKTDSPNSQFSKMFGDWKQLMARLLQIRDRYQKDPAVDKKSLEAQYNEILKQAKAMQDPLIEAAEKAYRDAPNSDKQVNDFLINNLRRLVEEDDYEEAIKLANLLTENKFEHKELDLLAGLAMFAANDFENAEKHLQAARAANVINDYGSRDLAMIDRYKLLWAKEEAIRKAEDKAGDLPKVKLSTTKGDIVLVLFENEAPIATANFISLIDAKFYDGKTFHRVLPHFMAQGGDPKGDGSGGPGYTIPDECRQANHRLHFRGSLSMAKTQEPDTGGSQFFLVFAPTSHLDGKHTVFGRIVEGMDVLAKLQRIEPDRPGTPDKILKATVLSKRKHKYEPIKKFDSK